MPVPRRSRAEPLVIVALDAQRLGDAVRWEGSPGGGVFPHVYASLPASAVTAVYTVDGAVTVDTALPST